MRPALRLLALALVAAGVGASAAALTGAWDGGDSASTRRPTAPVAGSFDATGIGAEPAPAFSVPAPQLESGRVARWATVRRPTAARRSPSRAAPVVARVGTRTPEGTANLLLLLRTVRRGGAVWALARLPVLPNDTVGWVEQQALGGSHFVHTHLVVDRARRRLTLLRDGRTVFAASVGVGTPSAPTPAGEFYVRDRLTTLARSFYGPVAFGTSARSPVLTDWPGGGFVGIHGTSEPQLIPGAVSHGCIRLRNADILRLDRLLEVGTPLTIR